MGTTAVVLRSGSGAQGTSESEWEQKHTSLHSGPSQGVAGRGTGGP